MLPLCKALQIGVNDLLSGERLCEDNYRKRAEENLMNLIEENRENKNRMLYSVLCVGVTVVAVAALVALASFLTIPVPARILLLLLAVLTGVTGIFVAAQLEWRAGYYECPHCKAQFVPSMRDYVKGYHTLTRRRLTCPHCGRTGMCRHRIVRSEKGRTTKGPQTIFVCGPLPFFIWRERVGIEPTYAATNCNYWF